jgi:hypothetical protein
VGISTGQYQSGRAVIAGEFAGRAVSRETNKSN